ncbi:DNA N-glycosylase and apurinic/apyrimidinic (AP) lyase [Serendipita sp. 399]|nr:DNA N-glycosylase and apurinic/apyrimidinic (AP) lyase [Serendipita sp. 399]
MPRRTAKTKASKEVKLEEEEGQEIVQTEGPPTQNMKTKLEAFSFGSGPTTVVSKSTTTTTSTSTTKKRKRSESPPMNLLHTPAASISPRKAKVYKMELDEPHPPPANWELTYRAIEEMRKEKTAPVDSMGCHVPMLDARIDQQARRFITLVSLMLSAQTKDEVTHAAVQNLRATLRPEKDADPHKEYLTVPTVLATPVSTIESCINKVGFWRRKAQYIKSTAEILHREYEDDIPRSIEGLCALPGVGMKMAMLTMQTAWGDNVGIGVDVHVHRITNRLGWHYRGKKETKTPEETRLNLESWLPREFHPTINPLLVGFGQTVCMPVRPKCEECLLSSREFELEKEDGERVSVSGPLCPSAFKGSPTKGSRRPKTKESVKDEDRLDEEARLKVEIEE